MTVEELIKLLRDSNPKDRVLIATSEPTHFGPKTGVNIAHIYNGFDWDNGNTYIVGNLDLYLERKDTL